MEHPNSSDIERYTAQAFARLSSSLSGVWTDAICVLDPTDDGGWLGDQMSKLFALEQEGGISPTRQFRHIVHPDDLGVLDSAIGSLIDDRETVVAISLRMKVTDERFATVLVRLVAGHGLVGVHDQILALLSVLSDLTYSGDLRTIAATAVHDLNNALGTIIPALELALLRGDQSPAVPQLRAALAAARKAADLSENLSGAVKK